MGELDQGRLFVLGRLVETAIPFRLGEFAFQVGLNRKAWLPAGQETWAQKNDDPPPASYRIL
jgi:hypothetical protein